VNHELSLLLELLGQDPDGLRFRLLFRNQSHAKIHLPFPEIHRLRLGNKATRQESEWYTGVFVQSTWLGFSLRPGEEKSIEYRVRPRDVEPPELDHLSGPLRWEIELSDHNRWCVELPPGEYLVWFQFTVDEDYFCGDSHYNYTDLIREAEAVQAVVWSGQAMSNRLTLIRG
jgi:hypothetical protein